MAKTLELTYCERTQKLLDISDDLSRMLPAFRHALDQLKVQVCKDQNQLFSFENHAHHIQQRLWGVKERQRGKIKVRHQLDSQWRDVCDPTALALLSAETPPQHDALGHIEQLSLILSDYDKIATALAHTIPGLKGPGLKSPFGLLVPRQIISPGSPSRHRLHLLEQIKVLQNINDDVSVVASDLHQTICDTQDTQSIHLTNMSHSTPWCSAVVDTSPDIHSGDEFASNLHQTICDTQDTQSLLLTDKSYSTAWCGALVGTSPDIHSDDEFASNLHQTICDTQDTQTLLLTDTSHSTPWCSAVVGTSPDIHSDDEFANDLHQTICNTKNTQSLLLTDTSHSTPWWGAVVGSSPDIHSENETCKHSLPPKQAKSMFSVLTQSLRRCLGGGGDRPLTQSS